MRIKNLKGLPIIVAAALALGVTSCQSSQDLIEPKHSLKQKVQPQFLDDIAVAGKATSIRLAAGERISDRRAGFNPSLTNVLQAKYANALRVVPEAITNLPLYNFIEDWYGVRYRMGGNDRKGIDCSAFVQRLYESVFCTNLVRTAMQQFHNCKLVFNQDSLKEGDLVFFHTRGKRISHVGIYLMNKYFVHASSTQGVIISSLDERYWSRFYAGAGKISRETSF